MSSLKYFNKTLLSVGLASILLAGCAASTKPSENLVNLRQQLTQLQGESQLAMQAPLEIKEAEQAVVLAEKPEKNNQLAEHRVVMAERKITMARTLAQTRLLEQQRDALNQKRDEVRLNARTREAANARADASDARNETQQARLQASNAQTKADNALNEARFARQQANQSDAEAANLRNEIAELNARPTDRGLVVTLGDVLFDTAKAGLKNTSSSHLEKLAIFLNAYPTRTAQIEGHTDEVGSDAANMLLSQKRADTVKAYLVAQGIASSRLVTSGKGENSPIATNATAEGRQQNRRVEVIIANAKE